MEKLLTIDDEIIEKLVDLLFMDDISFNKFPFDLVKTLV